LFDRLEGHLVRGERIIVAAFFEEQRAEVVLCAEERLVERDRLLVCRNRFAAASRGIQRVAEAELNACVIRRKVRGLLHGGERFVIPAERAQRRRAQREQRGVSPVLLQRAVGERQRLR